MGAFFFAVYALVVYLLVGCVKKPVVFSNGDKVEVREVVEPDMPQGEK